MVLERYSTTTMMGSIWAKIWGKRSTSDKLASICERLSSIEEFNRNTLERQKKLIGRLLVYFASLYLLSVTFVYFRYGGDPQWRQGWQQQLKLLLPFLVSPFVAWLVKRLLAAWYRRQLRNNDVAMKKLIVAKAKILEEVMETETYKVAKDLLDRYGSGKSTVAAAAVKTPVVVKQELRQRRGVAPPSPPPDVTTTTDRGDFHPVVRGGGGATTATLGMPPMPRPVLPRERGYVDRIVEYLVGDGPSNRYALVCRQCQSHNGMALREEFEYVSYRCCYCFCWNPARKQRPSAPKLLTKGSSPSPSSPSSTSSSSSSSGRGGGGGDKNDDDDNEAIFQTSRHFAEVEEEEEEQLTKSAPEINPNKTDEKVDEDVAADGKKEME